MVIYLDKQAGQATIFHSRKDLAKLLKVSETTLYNWSKKRYRETNEYNLYFDVEDLTAKTKRRKNNF